MARSDKQNVGKPTREGQIFLEELMALPVGTRLVKVFEEGEGGGQSKLVFNHPGVQEGGTKFKPGVRSLHTLLSEAGVIPYPLDTWNQRNWLRLAKEEVDLAATEVKKIKKEKDRAKKKEDECMDKCCACLHSSHGF